MCEAYLAINIGMEGTGNLSRLKINNKQKQTTMLKWRTAPAIGCNKEIIIFYLTEV
jgi:hypothetical protein